MVFFLTAGEDCYHEQGVGLCLFWHLGDLRSFCDYSSLLLGRGVRQVFCCSTEFLPSDSGNRHCNKYCSCDLLCQRCWWLEHASEDPCGSLVVVCSLEASKGSELAELQHRTLSEAKNWKFTALQIGRSSKLITSFAVSCLCTSGIVSFASGDE